MFRSLALGAAAVAVALSGTTPAEAWPDKPVKLVVPFPAGGSTDVVGRVIAQNLSERLGQQVVVDNRPGASGTLGSDMVAKAPADGYTIVISNVGSQGIGPALFKNVKYDTMRDFTHIGMIGTFTNVLIVHPSVPAKSLGELIAMAKKEPGKLSYGTSGNGSSNHFLGELLKHYAKIDMVHVPYKGSGPALNDVIANQIPLMFDSLPSSAGHIKAGSVRALAVAGASRIAALPDVPTFKEGGFDKLVIANWFGISGPAKMPAAAVERINTELKAILAQPEVVKRLADLGLTAQWMPSPEFATFVSENLDLWRNAVRDTGIKVD